MKDEGSQSDPLKGVRKVHRLASIGRIGLVKGWGQYPQRLGLPDGQVRVDRTVTCRGDDAQRLREAFEKLGPTIAKFCQMLSQRQILFPASLLWAMRVPKDQVGSVPAKTARQIIEDDAGFRVDQLFPTFEDRPLATASMAQVHGATLRNGTSVTFKVQRPRIGEMIEADIPVRRHLARLMDHLLSTLRPFNHPDLVEEERNAECFTLLNQIESFEFAPKVFSQATARHVLVTKNGPGHRVDQSEAGIARGLDTAMNLMQLFLIHVFERCLFHAGPHPGNVFLYSCGRLFFHDFRAMGELSPRVQRLAQAPPAACKQPPSVHAEHSVDRDQLRASSDGPLRPSLGTTAGSGPQWILRLGIAWRHLGRASPQLWNALMTVQLSNLVAHSAT